MPRSRSTDKSRKNKKCRSRSSSRSSRNSNCRSRSRSNSRSSSRSRSRSCSPPRKVEKVIVVEKKHSSKNKCDDRKSDKCDDRKSDKCNDRKSDKCDDRKRHHKQRSCSPKVEKIIVVEKVEDCESSDSDDDCDIEERYCYYKKHLLKDPSLMLAGSQVYADLYATVPVTIPIDTPLIYTINDPAIRNVEYTNRGGDVFVRESGMYLLNYSLETNESAQFAVFINNVVQPDTVTGTNSGSGQLVSNTVLKLKKNDSVTVRNYTSSVIGGAVTIIQFGGGSQIQADVQFTLFKIAPHPDDYGTCDIENYKCHSDHEKLFCRLTEKLLCDPCLMVKGFDSYGTFYATTSQTISIESPVIFNLAFNHKGLEWTPGTAAITVKDAGVYAIFAQVNTLQVAQFSIFVNGVALPGSIAGINKGASILSTRIVTELKCNDVVTWVNHTSAVPAVTSQNPGGFLAAINAELNMVKISPPTCYEPCKNEKCAENPCCKEEQYCEPEDVREFKRYLLHNCKLQIDGSKYLSIGSTTQQSIATGNSIIWKRKSFARCVQNIQGKPEVHICEDGEYELIGAVNSSQPDQFTLFVNGKPWTKTTTGKDSGAASTIITYNLGLCKGDCLTLVNYQSLINPVVTSSNAGGTQVGVNAFLILYKLGAKWEDCCKPVCPPTSTSV